VHFVVVLKTWLL